MDRKKVWWTNGKDSVRDYEPPGPEWYKGRVYSKETLERYKAAWQAKPHKPKISKKLELNRKFELKNPIRIEIFDWMWLVWDLEFEALIVYSLIYNELELTTQEIINYLQIEPERCKKIIFSLRNKGLIKSNDVKKWVVTEKSIV